MGFLKSVEFKSNDKYLVAHNEFYRSITRYVKNAFVISFVLWRTEQHRAIFVFLYSTEVQEYRDSIIFIVKEGKIISPTLTLYFLVIPIDGARCQIISDFGLIWVISCKEIFYLLHNSWQLIPIYFQRII